MAARAHRLQCSPHTVREAAAYLVSTCRMFNPHSYDESPEERQRRIAWIKYYVEGGKLQEAFDLGWSVPRAPPHLPHLPHLAHLPLALHDCVCAAMWSQCACVRALCMASIQVWD